MLLTLVADDFEDQISKLRSEMNQQTREAVLGEVTYQDRCKAVQNLTVCVGHEKQGRTGSCLHEIDLTNPRNIAESTIRTFMELTADCYEESWHINCDAASIFRCKSSAILGQAFCINEGR